MSKRLLGLAVFSLMAATIALPAQNSGKAQTIGSLENGSYQDQTGVQFTLPPDWLVVSHGSASGGAHTVLLRDPITNVIATVWLKPRTVDPAAIPGLMSRRLDSKLAQRNNFEGYTYRSDSVRNSTIGGRPALSAVADYVRAGQKMTEYLTWIDGEKSRVAFVARMPESELADFQGRFDAVIQSAIVP
jgi:hypothetical protein